MNTRGPATVLKRTVVTRARRYSVPLMKSSILWLLVGVAPVGCTKPNPALSCEDGLCSDPAVPYCDLDGTLGGEGPNTCIHVSCTPNEFAACRGDKALTCNATGDNYDLLTCENGCSADENGCKPAPPCDTLECQKHIVPRYVPSECNDLATKADYTISADTTIDTANELMCTNFVTQANGPEICVIHAGTIKIEAGATLTAVGSRALALVADTSLVIDGVLDANGRSGNAAGGGTRLSGDTNNTKAGGGAGYRTKGGGGGAAGGDGAANDGGPACPNPSTITDLFGGPRTDAYNNGGGAITLISCRADVSIAGIIDLGGGGGHGTRDFAPQGGGHQYATGGGAGGTLVLQGTSLNVTGQLFANGGGGGGANATMQSGRIGENGAAGGRSLVPASGGDSATTRHGGVGGTDTPPGAGGSNGTDEAGAGGGAAGFILRYTPAGAQATFNPAMISPSAEASGVIPTN